MTNDDEEGKRGKGKVERKIYSLYNRKLEAIV